MHAPYTAVAFSEDVLARYAAYGWHVQSVDVLPDGNVDVEGLARASLNKEGWSQLARASVGIEVDLANSFGARNSTALFLTVLWQEIQKTNQEN